MRDEGARLLALRAACLCALAFVACLRAPAMAGEAPQDKPVAVASNRQMQALEAAMAPYIAQARASWPGAKARFLAGLPAGQRLFATMRLEDADGRVEQVFVFVRGIRDGRIEGRIASEISTVQGYRAGDAVSFDESLLRDWTISHPDGVEEGNAVGKFLDTWTPPE